MAILTRIAYCCDLSPLYEATMEGGGGRGYLITFVPLKEGTYQRWAVLLFMKICYFKQTKQVDNNAHLKAFSWSCAIEKNNIFACCWYL